MRYMSIYIAVMVIQTGVTSVGCVIIHHPIGACGSVIIPDAKGMRLYIYCICAAKSIISKFYSFNHLICPEPGCDYVSEIRQEIERHMMLDHMSVKNANLKLFFCPACSQNLELKDREEYEQMTKYWEDLSGAAEGSLPRSCQANLSVPRV